MRTRQPLPVNLVIYPGSGTTGALLMVEGEIDVASADFLRGALTRYLLDGSSVIDLDLAGVTFCDSSGLHVFLDISKAAARTGGILRLHNPSPMVHRLFTLTGTGKLLLPLPAHAAPTPRP